MKKSIAFILMAILVLGITTGASAAASLPKEPQELTINLFQEPYTLDWQGLSSTGEIQIYNWVMEGLTRSAGKGTVKPGIASKWEVSPDGKVWTFHLRDAKWSDGTAVTAADFKYGAMRALGPKTPRDYTYLLYDIVGAEEYSNGSGTADKVGINVVDSKTIQYTLKFPVTYFDYLVSFPTFAPVKQAFCEKAGDKFNTDPQYFLTNGPFKIDSWYHEEGMIFAKNPKYWDAASIKLDNVKGYMIADSEEELLMYEAGELDQMISLDNDQKAAIIKKNEIKNYSDGSIWYFDYNCTHPALKNKNIRKALTYAIDRKSFIENTAMQPWKPATAFVQPDIIPDADGKTPWRNAKPSYFKDNDVDTAKKLLALGMKELGLTELPSMKLLVNDTYSGRLYAETFHEMWKKNLGIEIEVECVPSVQRIERQQAHEFDISLAGWGPDYPDPMTDLDLFVTGDGLNDSAYSNPEYDALIKAAKAETNKAKKYEMMRKAEDILMEDMPIGPLYWRYRDYAVKEYVKGFERDAFAPDIQFIYSWIEGKKK